MILKLCIHLISLKFSAFLDTSYKSLLFKITVEGDLEFGKRNRGQINTQQINSQGFSELAFRKKQPT